MNKKLGLFIKEKREQKYISLRSFSKMIGISPVYLSNIENGERPAPTNDILMRISDALSLDDKEYEIMLDLAAQTKKNPCVAYDLAEYLLSNSNAYKVLRLSKRYNANEEDWNMFEDYLSQKYS
jgi:transcriptional regulator with XRE-family HTH domain